VASIRIVNASRRRLADGNDQKKRSGRGPHTFQPLQCKKGSNPGGFLKNYLRFLRLWQAWTPRNTVGNQVCLGLLAAIDSGPQSCTIDRPERNQMEVPMAIQAHLAELERKHEALENQLHEALNHLSTDDITIVEIKRRKLQVKDEIERLRSSATVH
jgi:hypothetical protein